MKPKFLFGFLVFVSLCLSSSLSLPVPPHKFTLKLEEAFPWTFDGPVDLRYSLPEKKSLEEEQDYYGLDEDEADDSDTSEEKKKCKKDELLYVAERKGKIWVFPNCKSKSDFDYEDEEGGGDMKNKKEVFLDISDRLTIEGEMGLLGFAFHPDFPKNPHVYLSYVRRENKNDASDSSSDYDSDSDSDSDSEEDVYTDSEEVEKEIIEKLRKGKSIVHYISKFKVNSRKEADKQSEKVLMKFYKPSILHQGGSIFFGKHDRYLYISLGDSKRPKEAQNPYSYLGKILRIDVNLKEKHLDEDDFEPIIENEDESLEIEEGVPPEDEDEDYDHDIDSDFNVAETTNDEIQMEVIAEELKQQEDEEEEEELNDKWYGIPEGNPYAQGGGYPEILALGFRNPWRCSSDIPQRGNKELQEVWCGDIGDKSWEEVNLIMAGKNYGWPIMEGFWCWVDIHCNEHKQYELPFFAYPHPDILDRTGRDDPELSREEREQDNSNRKWPYFPPAKYHFPFNGSAIIGGYLYQGDRIPWLKHGYVFGDYVSQKMGAFFYEGHNVEWVTEIVTPEEFTRGPIAFGVDSEEEFFILTQGRNRPLYKFAGWP